jgi:hypothetical protein
MELLIKHFQLGWLVFFLYLPAWKQHTKYLFIVVHIILENQKKKKKKRNGKRSFLMVFPQRLEVNEEKGRKEGRKNQKAA